ncbi:MAG TPA: hypothetical protein PK351_01630 [Spirochaetota bacterium]|nr:hypothetical protein [Spirochaetota bacterium]HPP03502.1 hypothetical protein [Spirochaetota bacterium]
MKKIYFIFFINFFLYSEEILYQEIQYNNFLIKCYSTSKILVDKIYNKKNEYFFIAGNKDSNFSLLIELPYIKGSLVKISSNYNFYFELYYDDKKNNLVLNNLLGDFNIEIFNSILNLCIKKRGIDIVSGFSSYNFISYTDNLFYIYLKEGRVQFIKKKNITIIISGESFAFIDGKNYVSRFNDPLTAKNILVNNLYSNLDKIEDSRYFSNLEKKFINSIIYNKIFIDNNF